MCVCARACVALVVLLQRKKKSKQSLLRKKRQQPLLAHILVAFAKQKGGKQFLAHIPFGFRKRGGGGGETRGKNLAHIPVAFAISAALQDIVLIQRLH